MRLSPQLGRPLPLVAPGSSAQPAGREPPADHRLSSRECGGPPRHFGSLAPSSGHLSPGSLYCQSLP